MSIMVLATGLPPFASSPVAPSHPPPDVEETADYGKRQSYFSGIRNPESGIKMTFITDRAKVPYVAIKDMPASALKSALQNSIGKAHLFVTALDSEDESNDRTKTPRSANRLQSNDKSFKTIVAPETPYTAPGGNSKKRRSGKFVS